MAYTLEQIYAALGTVENGGAMVADLQNALQNTRNEAARYRTDRNKVLDALGLRDDGNVEQSLGNLANTLNVIRQIGDPGKVGTQITDLQKSLKDLTDKYNESQKKAQEEHDRRVRTSVRSKLLSALTQGKAVKPEEIVKMFSGSVTMKDDDTAVMKSGDKELSLEDGVAAWLKANPWAVKNDVQTGAGGGSGSGAGGHKYSMEDLKKMSREQINEHWGEISKGLNEGAEK